MPKPNNYWNDRRARETALAKLMEEGARLDVLALRSAFGREWDYLGATEHVLMVDDLREAVRDEGSPPPKMARKLARRIGAGNLSSYVDCLKARAARADQVK